MYTLIRQAGARHWLMVEAPSLTVALVVAELFYRFGSFTLECVGFLATWAAVSWLSTRISQALAGAGRAR